MSSEIIDELAKNSWFQISGWVLGALGVVYAVIESFISRKCRKVTFSKRSFNLVSRHRATIASLSVLFNGRPVSALTVTKIVVWNSGKEAIRFSDFPELEKLRIITVGDIEILDVTLLQQSTRSCDCSVVLTSVSECALGFEFLDPMDGFVVQVAHTGSSSKNLEVKGEIIGKGRVKEKNKGGVSLGVLDFISFINTRRSVHHKRVLLLVIHIIFACIMFACPFILYYKPLDVGNQGSVIRFFILMYLMGFVYLINGLIIWKSRPPRGLEKFDDGFESNKVRDNAELPKN